jgi:hypothetical protein
LKTLRNQVLKMLKTVEEALLKIYNYNFIKL